MNTKNTSVSVYDVTIKLLLILVVVVWCLMILYPFISIMLWGFILAVAFKPVHDLISKATRGSKKFASLVIILVSIAVIFVPSWRLLDNVIAEVSVLKEDFTAGRLSIPPPTEKLKTFPVAGKELYSIWQSASTDIEGTIIKYKEPLTEAGKYLAKGILGAAGGVLQMVISLIIAGVLLVSTSTADSIRKFFRRVAGESGGGLADIVFKTIRNVVKGVIGVAVILAFLIGGGFMLAGVPYAGILTILVFVFAVLQLPTILAIIPVIVYLFSHMDTGTAIIWSVYFILAGLSDNVIRPLLLGKGAPVPMLVIFIGVAGGFILMGFIGLFTGAVVMTLGYTLFTAWLNDKDDLFDEETPAQDKN